MSGADLGSFVESLLQEGVRDLVNKAFFIRLAALKRDLGRQIAYRPVFDLIGSFSPREICELATPFFWFNVLRVNDEALADTVSAGFVTTAIDCFLPATNPDTELMIDLPVLEDGYAFPKIGLRYPLAPGDKLRHVGGGRIVHEPVGGSAALPMKITKPVPGHARIMLLSASDPTLFHDEYRHKIVPYSENAESLAAMIGRAVDVIDRLAPSLSERMNRMVRWYVPISSDDFQVHNSFSASTLLGVIFLSDSYSSLRLAEAIVHEYHHNQLFHLMAGEELFIDVDGPVHYSPWRNDPRPLTGLFHALYVFTNVLQFLRLAVDDSSFKSIRGEIAEECTRLQWQLAIGLLQVPMNRVSPIGRKILAGVRTVTGCREAIPEGVARHLTDWRHRNPSLSVTLP